MKIEAEAVESTLEGDKPVNYSIESSTLCDEQVYKGRFSTVAANFVQSRTSYAHSNNLSNKNQQEEFNLLKNQVLTLQEENRKF